MKRICVIADFNYFEADIVGAFFINRVL